MASELRDRRAARTCRRSRPTWRKFKQVLYNLLSNAMKFSPERRGRGAAAVARRPRSRRCSVPTIAVAVRDEGIGIDADDHELIFEEFRQVDGSAQPRVRRHRPRPGAGASSFVELQGGTVTVESALGQGSTFTVHAAAASARRGASSPADGGRRMPEPGDDRVLVVEDDANAYELIARAPRRRRLGADPRAHTATRR